MDLKLPKYTEFESKYRTTVSKIPLFNEIAEAIPGLKKYLFVKGWDSYYTKPNDLGFGRYRISDDSPNEKRFAQWTVKQKPLGAKNNISRFESNWDVSLTSPEEIHAGAKAMGYSLNFEIYKTGQLYIYDDANIVIYSVRERDSDEQKYYIEIEIDEETIHKLTKKEAMSIIVKYEKLLKPVGINAHKRLKQSLFEMYKKNI